MFLLKSITLANKNYFSIIFKSQIILSINIKGRFHIILDISGCDIFIKEQNFFNIQKYFLFYLQNHKKTKTVVLKDINKDIKKDYYYFIFFHIEKVKKAIKTHIRKWLLSAFL